MPAHLPAASPTLLCTLQERLRSEQEAELRRREAAQRQEAQRQAAAAAAARSAHPYDAAYHPSLQSQLAAQQQFYYGQPVDAVARQHQRQQQQQQLAQQQYATVRGITSTRNVTPERERAVAVQRKGAPLPPTLDPRSFAPLGAGAAGLQQGLHRQRSAGANAAAAAAATAAYDRRYTTIG